MRDDDTDSVRWNPGPFGRQEVNKPFWIPQTNGPDTQTIPAPDPSLLCFGDLNDDNDMSSVATSTTSEWGLSTIGPLGQLQPSEPQRCLADEPRRSKTPPPSLICFGEDSDENVNKVDNSTSSSISWISSPPGPLFDAPWKGSQKEDSPDSIMFPRIGELSPKGKIVECSVI